MRNICLLVVAMLVVWVDMGWTGHFPVPDSTRLVSDFLGTVKIDGVVAQPGDEIAFYDPDGVLCGLTVVKQNTPGLYGILHVYGDDNSTLNIDEGARSGDELTVRVWDANNGWEFSGSGIRLLSGQSSGSAHSSPVPPQWYGDVIYVLNVEAGFNGDMNLDDVLNVGDVILALQVAVAIGHDEYSTGIDIDGDGQLGLSEAVYIMQLLAGVR